MKLVKYYPVGNGDTSLVVTDQVRIITDCKIRDDEEYFDVKADLLDELETRDGNPYTDLFVLSHHDQDHCLNFDKHFHTGKVDQYIKEDEKIIVDELWVNEFILSDKEVTDDSDAAAIRDEVKRRRNLYKNGDPASEKRGNRLVLIGYDDNENFEGVPNYIPGDTCSTLNGEELDRLEFFIHAPFKKHIIDCNATGDRNMSSIVYQLRFYKNDQDFECRILHGGDADHYRWAEIKKQCENHDNEDALYWDIFQTPHHCSWSYFNDTPYKDTDRNIDHSKPKENSLEILDYSLQGGKVVATSKKVLDDDKNPPHYAARKEYIKKVGEANFLNTEEHFERKKEPIVFEIEEGQVSFKRVTAPLAISTGTSKPSRAG